MSSQTSTRTAGFIPPRSSDGRYAEYKSRLASGHLTVPAETDEAPAEYTAVGRFAKLREAHETFRNRCRELMGCGYMPAGASEAAVDPRSREGIDTYWAEHYAATELAAGSGHGEVAVLPDNYTPAMSSGHSLDGHRRTHRMGYSGEQTALRMPSATSIRRFASEQHGKAFDVPVEATYPGGSFSGYVRVTQNGPGQWSVSTRGVDPNTEKGAAANAYVSESVQAVLEARSVSRALRDIPDILERRAERLKTAGTNMREVFHSDVVRRVGYNAASRDLTIDLGGRTYGYHGVERETYEEILKPTDRVKGSGGVYNRLVKGRGQRSFPVQQCGTCHRWHEAGAIHKCPGHHVIPAVGPESKYKMRVRRLLLRSAAHDTRALPGA